MRASIHTLQVTLHGCRPALWRRLRRRGVGLIGIFALTAVFGLLACGRGVLDPSAQLQGAYDFGGCEGVQFVEGISCHVEGGSASHSSVYAGRLTFTLPNNVHWVVHYRDNRFGTLTERTEDLEGTFVPPENGFVSVTLTASGRIETLTWDGQNRLTWQRGIMKPLFDRH